MNDHVLLTIALAPVVSILAFSAVSNIVAAIYFPCFHVRGTRNYVAATFFLLAISIAILVVVAAAIPAVLISKCWTTMLQKWRRLRGKVNARESGDAPSWHGTTQSTIVVHLVHGTFEPDAGWTQEGSALRRTIGAAGPGIVFNRIVWTGGNDQTDRDAAAKQIANAIRTCPSNRQFVIAHSHGGNATLHALQYNIDLLPKVEGFAALSTPFIVRSQSPRETLFTSGLLFIGEDITLMLLAFMALGMIDLLMTLFGIHMHLLQRGADQFVFVTACTAALTWLIHLLLEKKSKKHVEAQAAQYDDRSKHNHLISQKTGIFHVVGDEADSGLRTISLLHAAAQSAMANAERANDIFQSRRVWVSGVILLITTALAYRGFAVKPGATAENFMFWGLALSALIAFCFFARDLIPRIKKGDAGKPTSSLLIGASVPLATANFVLNATKSLAYGDASYMLSPHSFIHSSETPAGDWHVFKFGPVCSAAKPALGSAKDGLSLIHSSHGHPQVLEALREWVQSRLPRDCVAANLNLSSELNQRSDGLRSETTGA